MPTSGRWRSSTGDWCKLAGWHRVSLPDRESALGPPGVSGDLWGKLLASSLLWHHRGTGDRERESERERERGSWRHYRIKQLRSPLASSASLFMWLSGLGLRQNQTPAGHLMIERISELIGRCRGIWTQMTRGTLGCADRHTQAYHTNTREDRTWHT